MSHSSTLPAGSWLDHLVGALAQQLQAWRQRQRAAAVDRRNLIQLAAMTERDLADFGAPCSLRADVRRYR